MICPIFISYLLSHISLHNVHGISQNYDILGLCWPLSPKYVPPPHPLLHICMTRSSFQTHLSATQKGIPWELFSISALPYLSHAGFPFSCLLYLFIILLYHTNIYLKFYQITFFFLLLYVLIEHILYKGHWVPWCRLHLGLIRLTESFLSWSLHCIRKDRNGN